MGSSIKCCSNEEEKNEFNLNMTLNSDLIFPINLSLHEVSNMKKYPEFSKPISTPSNKSPSKRQLEQINNEEASIFNASKTIPYKEPNSLRYIKFRIFASYDEQMLPLWVDNGATLKFRVKTSWSLYNNQKEIGYDGDSDQSIKLLGYNVGSLLGRIDSKFFQISSNTEVTVLNRGCLFVFQNNGLFETNPNGYADIEILGGRIYSYLEIEKLFNWPYKELYPKTEGSEIKLLDQEKDLIYLINKLRYDPEYFCNCYISHLKELSKEFEISINEIKDSKNHRITSLNSQIQGHLENDKQNLKLSSSQGSIFKSTQKQQEDYILNYNEKLQKISIERSVERNYVKEDKINDEKALSDMLKKEEIESIFFCEICTFGKSSALGVLLHVLIDDEDVNNKMNREGLINNDYTDIGVSIRDHDIFGYSCSIILAKIK